jgi:hypothetical protein
VPLILPICVVTYQLKPGSASLLAFVSTPITFVSQAGATAGAIGAYFVGSIVGLTVGSGDALPYHNRLNAGKYLVVVKGTEALTQQATRILRQFEPENLQGYREPTGA